MIDTIGSDGSGGDGSGDVQVNLANGGSIVFEGIAFATQMSIADLVDNNTQVVVDHL